MHLEHSEHVSNSVGEIYAKKPLDAETQNEYHIDVIAQDNGSPSLSTTCQIVVQVLDINDNAPYFILPHQNKVSIREEQPVGTEVVQVRASDPDQGANGTITYSLAGNSREIFCCPCIKNYTCLLQTLARVFSESTARLAL